MLYFNVGRVYCKEGQSHHDDGNDQGDPQFQTGSRNSKPALIASQKYFNNLFHQIIAILNDWYYFYLWTSLAK